MLHNGPMQLIHFVHRSTTIPLRLTGACHPHFRMGYIWHHLTLMQWRPAKVRHNMIPLGYDQHQSAHIDIIRHLLRNGAVTCLCLHNNHPRTNQHTIPPSINILAHHRVQPSVEWCAPLKIPFLCRCTLLHSHPTTYLILPVGAVPPVGKKAAVPVQ